MAGFKTQKTRTGRVFSIINARLTAQAVAVIAIVSRIDHQTLHRDNVCR